MASSSSEIERSDHHHESDEEEFQGRDHEEDGDVGPERRLSPVPIDPIDIDLDSSNHDRSSDEDHSEDADYFSSSPHHHRLQHSLYETLHSPTNPPSHEHSEQPLSFGHHRSEPPSLNHSRGFNDIQHDSEDYTPVFSDVFPTSSHSIHDRPISEEDDSHHSSAFVMHPSSSSGDRNVTSPQRVWEVSGAIPKNYSNTNNQFAPNLLNEGERSYPQGGDFNGELTSGGETRQHADSIERTASPERRDSSEDLPNLRSLLIASPSANVSQGDSNSSPHRIFPSWFYEKAAHEDDLIHREDGGLQHCHSGNTHFIAELNTFSTVPNTQLAGPTAVVNVLTVLGYNFETFFVARRVPHRQRQNLAPLPEYLLSRSVAGSTSQDLIKGAELVSKGEVSGRFFSFYPAKNVCLRHWLISWMQKGCVPVLIMNVQRRPAGCSGAPPDDWMTALVYGVDGTYIYLAAPGRMHWAEAAYCLCSPSDLLVSCEEICQRFDEDADLALLAESQDPRMVEKNVLDEKMMLFPHRGIPILTLMKYRWFFNQG